MAIRHAAVALLAVIAIPFVVSSPGHAAFWVTMGAVALVMLPLVGVTAYFHLEIRRILREGKHFADPS
jgi:hypothetical protein